MNRYYKMLIAVVLALSSTVPLTRSYGGIHIEIGDRGYYTHGRFYVENGRRWCWVPGHWGRHHRWIHGHYRPCR